MARIYINIRLQLLIIRNTDKRLFYHLATSTDLHWTEYQSVPANDELKMNLKYSPNKQALYWMKI